MPSLRGKGRDDWEVCHLLTVQENSSVVTPSSFWLHPISTLTGLDIVCGTERVSGTHPERVSGTHLGFQNGHSGQEW